MWVDARIAGCGFLKAMGRSRLFRWHPVQRSKAPLIIIHQRAEQSMHANALNVTPADARIPQRDPKSRAPADGRPLSGALCLCPPTAPSLVFIACTRDCPDAPLEQAGKTCFGARGTGLGPLMQCVRHCRSESRSTPYCVVRTAYKQS